MLTRKELRDTLNKEQLIDLVLSVNSHYLEVSAKCQEYREMFDKVKAEDLCATVQEREASLKNDVALREEQMRAIKHDLDARIWTLENCLKDVQDLITGVLDTQKSV